MARHRPYRASVLLGTLGLMGGLKGAATGAEIPSEQRQAIRRMFVSESGGYDSSAQSLWLLQAIPRCWLRPGNRLAVRDMGTFFGGKVNLEVEMARDGNSVVAWVRLGLQETPREIRLRLRSGDSRPLAAATVNGQPVAIGAGDTLLLPLHPQAHCRIVGRFQG